MNFFLKNKNLLLDLKFLLINPAFKRFVFNESFFKIDHFKKEVQFMNEKFDKNSNKLKQKILNCVQTSQIENLELRDLNSLIFLSKDIHDIDFVINTIKILLKNNKIPIEQQNGLGIQLIRLIYVLSREDYGLKLLKDDDLKLIFKSAYPKLMLMNKLMIEKKYNQVIELFEFYLPVYKKPNEKLPNKFSFPHDQFILVTIALMNLNSKESFNRMKFIIDKIKIKKLEFVNTSISRCFLLAINQNEPEYALSLLSKFSNLNVSLGFNLSIIAMAKMGLVEEAVKIVKNLLDTKLSPDSSKFEGRFFPYSIRTLSEEIKKLDSSNRNKDFVEKFNLFENMIKLDKRYLDLDLEDYCKKSMN